MSNEKEPKSELEALAMLPIELIKLGIRKPLIGILELGVLILLSSGCYWLVQIAQP